MLKIWSLKWTREKSNVLGENINLFLIFTWIRHSTKWIYRTCSIFNEKQFAHHSGEALHLHVNSNAAITAAADHDGPGSHAFGALPDFQGERERTKNSERNYVTDPSKETDIQTLDTDTARFEHVSPSPQVGNDMDLLSSKEHGHVTHAMHDFAAE